ncbi:MAG: UPF0104 family protein [Methanobacteriaceae archaeon]|nr:UPF0104 family protein [Methanobacteriaceae archaeon]
MKYKKIIALLSIGILILIAMIIIVGPQNIESVVKNANLYYVAFAIILQFVIIGVWTIRWKVIIRTLGISIKNIKLIPMMFIGLTVNNITPSGRGGGEPVRAYMLSNETNAPFQKTFATVLGDKTLDTLPFFVLAIFSILYLIYSVHLDSVTLGILILALIIFTLICIFLIYICINQKVGVKVVKWIFRQLNRFVKRDLDEIEKKAVNAVLEFQMSVKELLKNKNMATIALPLSFLVWFLELLRVYIIFLAFGVTVPFGIIAAVFIISTLIGMIPLLPGGVGAIDGMMVILYSVAGVPAAISTAATLVERLISFWLVSALGLTLLPFAGKDVLDKINGNILEEEKE